MNDVATRQESRHEIGMSSDDYHAHPAIGKSVLDMAHSDPHAVKWARNAPEDKDKTAALDFGDAMHAICLEPERLDSEFVVMPAFNLRTNAGKADRNQFVKENENKKILTDDEHKKLRLMFESVMAHEQARDLIEAEGICEGSYFWTDKETGIDCKCRPDKEIASRNLLVDVKTTDTLGKFKFSVDDFRYYVQDPFYCDGVGQFKDKPQMLFLVIAKHINCGRYPVMVCKLPDEALMYGRIEYQNDLRRYARFLEAGRPVREYNELPMHFRFIDRCMENLEVHV